MIHRAITAKSERSKPIPEDVGKLTHNVAPNYAIHPYRSRCSMPVVMEQRTVAQVNYLVG